MSHVMKKNYRYRFINVVKFSVSNYTTLSQIIHLRISHRFQDPKRGSQFKLLGTPQEHFKLNFNII